MQFSLKTWFRFECCFVIPVGFPDFSSSFQNPVYKAILVTFQFSVYRHVLRVKGLTSRLHRILDDQCHVFTLLSVRKPEDGGVDDWQPLAQANLDWYLWDAHVPPLFSRNNRINTQNGCRW